MAEFYGLDARGVPDELKQALKNEVTLAEGDLRRERDAHANTRAALESEHQRSEQASNRVEVLEAELRAIRGGIDEALKRSLVEAAWPDPYPELEPHRHREKWLSR